MTHHRGPAREAPFPLPMPSSPTFPDLASRWLAASAVNLSAGTIAHYRWLLENYVFPGLGERVDVTEEEIRALVEAKRSQGLSESTLYALPKIIRRILSYGSAEGLCAAPGWEITQETPQRKTPAVILSPGQEQRLSAYLTGHPSPKNLGIYLVLTTGISAGELLTLTWADVSFPLKRIRVSMEKDSRPETRKKFRNIPLDERHLIFLKRLASRPVVYLASGKARPVSGGTLRSGFLSALREAGLPAMTLSDLRRSFAVRCLEGGMGYEDLGRRLGRKNGRNFRAEFDGLVSEKTRQRLRQETLAARETRQAPGHIDSIGPDISPEIVALRQKVEAKKRQLNEALAALEGDLEIVRSLRRGGHGGIDRPREGLCRLIEKLLGDDRDGKTLVEYLRCNLRVADMPSRQDVTVQTLRARISRGFSKLCDRLEELYTLADRFSRSNP